jgi:hypothetical protein
MSAGKQGPAQVAINYDDAPGGTLRNMTAYITSIGEIGVEQINEKTNPFGQAYESNSPVGVQTMPEVPIEGYFDTTATTGPHVVFGTPDTDPNGTTRTLTFSPGDSKLFTVETRLKSYKVIAQLGQLTKFRAMVTQAGAGAWT